MNKVVHCKKEPYDVYIGRPGKWGNPFLVAEYGREESLSLYRAWLYESIEGQEIIRSAKKELKNKVLGCWCFPKACHGNILVEAIDEQRLDVLV